MIDKDKIWIKHEFSRIKKEVCVEILNRVTSVELEEILDFYLKNSYSIQDSQVEFDCGSVCGVYVFILTESGK